MQDILDNLAANIRKTVIEYCAKVTDIHRRRGDDEYTRGYNAAVADIAAKIREMNK